MSVLFFPVRTVYDLETLDPIEISEGYLMGLRGDPEPRDSRAKWHGWKNGMVDSHRREKDKHQAQLAKELCSITNPEVHNETDHPKRLS